METRSASSLRAVVMVTDAVMPCRNLRSGLGASITAAYVTTFWIVVGACRTSRMLPLKVSPG